MVRRLPPCDLMFSGTRDSVDRNDFSSSNIYWVEIETPLFDMDCLKMIAFSDLLRSAIRLT